MLAPLIANFFDLFARSGGGGSGGGGGGGGIGIAAIGYLPMHALGAFLRRHGSSNTVASVLQQGIGWIVAVIYGIVWIFIWGGIGFIIAIGALLGIGAGLYNWFGKVKQSKLVSGRLKTAAATDRAWDETILTDYARQIFARYQADWSQFNTEAMRQYMTPQYHYHASLLMYALQLLGRQNVMSNVEIQEALITDARDSVNNTEDQFTIGITAKAHDQLIETATNENLFTDDGTFTEYWQFVRSGDGWLLGGISQATADMATYNAGIKAFADTNKFYYSPDMGWLFLPKRGYLFGKGKFGTSDINNHVIGMYNNQLLIQLYSFVAAYKSSNSSGKSLLVAQVNVPKNYGQIIVRRKKGLGLFDTPRGLEEVKTEWIEFNGKYEVFAAAPEQATSFELLNPTYMEKLAALDFDVNIEVVDNIIYLYSPEAKTDGSHYATMLSLIYDAFREMRL